MCTAATYKTKDFYFGRTLDYDFSYGDDVTIAPRKFVFRFIEQEEIREHYAIIGMAYNAEDYPLFYDAVNEKGLAMAGLNFVGNAHYREHIDEKENVAQFEFIPYILCRCATVKEARKLIENINILNTPFNDRLSVAQLHWIISDKDESITVESVKEGVKIYDNPVGVLTNNPPFEYQMFALNNYRQISTRSAGNRFSDKLELAEYSRGMGAIGLPGDISSQSRFVRAAFTKMNSISGDSEEESVSQFFHILNSVDNVRGCCELSEGRYEMTLYTSCCNTAKGIYYYTSYNNHQITAVDMHREDLNTDKVIKYPIIKNEQIRMQN